MLLASRLSVRNDKALGLCRRNDLIDKASLEASHVHSVIDHPRRSELWDAHWFLLVILNGDQDSFPDFAVATCNVTRTIITWLRTVHVAAATFVIDQGSVGGNAHGKGDVFTSVRFGATDKDARVLPPGKVARKVHGPAIILTSDVVKVGERRSSRTASRSRTRRSIATWALEDTSTHILTVGQWGRCSNGNEGHTGVFDSQHYIFW
jgi:hypothetical protein